MKDPGTKPEMSAPVKVYGRIGCAQAYVIRDFLKRSDVPFEWHELASDDEARSRTSTTCLRDPRLPLCVFPDGTRLEAPTIRQVTGRRRPPRLDEALRRGGRRRGDGGRPHPPLPRRGLKRSARGGCAVRAIGDGRSRSPAATQAHVVAST